MCPPLTLTLLSLLSLLHGSFHTDLSICLYHLPCALSVIHPLFPVLLDLCSLFYLFSSPSNSSTANFFPLPCLQSGITPSHHSIVAHFLRRVLFSAAVQKSRRNSMPNVKSPLKPTAFNSMCNPKRTRVDLIWQKTRIRRGRSQDVRNMLHRFYFRTDKRREGDIIMQPPIHPQWIYSTFGERKHVINRAVFPLLHLEIKWLPFQDSNTNMDIF